MSVGVFWDIINIRWSGFCSYFLCVMGHYKCPLEAYKAIKSL